MRYSSCSIRERNERSYIKIRDQYKTTCFNPLPGNDIAYGINVKEVDKVDKN